jgi:nitrous oxide reductase accessory protein NosL
MPVRYFLTNLFFEDKQVHLKFRMKNKKGDSHMKKIWIAVLLVLSLVTVCLAADKAPEKVEAPDACVHCGMDRTKFGHSRMIVTYTDGSSAGTCSLNCVGTDLLKGGKDKTVKSYQVADLTSKKLIDAKTATWVIGGSRKGVMTPVPKWAFADKGDAAAFAKVNGGKLATFDDAMKAMQKEHDDKAKKAADHKGHGH